MARGDYADITYKTGAGTEKVRVQARLAGGKVEVSLPARGNPFVTVEEFNSADKAIQTGRFAASEVVAITEGNAPLPTLTTIKPK